jgi:hypothetical protein
MHAVVGITNLQIGDYIENTETLQKYEIIDYQHTFCAICTQLPFMVFCPTTKDKTSMHYRFYRIRDVRTMKVHDVSGDHMDKAQFKRKIRQLSK